MSYAAWCCNNNAVHNLANNEFNSYSLLFHSNSQCCLLTKINIFSCIDVFNISDLLFSDKSIMSWWINNSLINTETDVETGASQKQTKTQTETDIYFFSTWGGLLLDVKGRDDKNPLWTKYIIVACFFHR